MAEPEEKDSKSDPTALTTDQLQREIKLLRQYYDAILEERDLRYETQFQSGKDAVEAAFKASEKAIDKAETSIEKRADATYVALGDLQRLLGTQMPRSEAEQRFADLADRITVMTNRLTTIEATKTGSKEQLTAIYALVGFLVTLMVLGGILAAAGIFGE